MDSPEPLPGRTVAALLFAAFAILLLAVLAPGAAVPEQANEPVPGDALPAPAVRRAAALPKAQGHLAASKAHPRIRVVGVSGVSERRLRAFEIATLGPVHAREHAVRRAQLRRSPRGEPSAQPKAATSAQATAAEDPAQVGRWGAPFSIPVMAVHSAVLPTGKVMWFSYPKNPSPRHGGDGGSSPNTAQAWLWDPATGQNKRVDPPLWRDPKDGQLKPANIWCAGQAFTADGRLVVAGGNLDYGYDGSDFKGLNKVYTFNPFNETWTEQPAMRRGRWYPSQVLLPDGRMPILSGLDETGRRPGNFNSEVEVFTPSSDMNGRGSLSYVGSRGGASQPPNGGLYPHLFSMPSGRTLVAGPYPTDSWFMSAPGASSFAWQDAPNTARDRLWGTGVLMPGGPGGSTRVMQIGGSAPPTVDSTTTDIATPTTETFDETSPGLGWRAGAPMKVGRAHHNTVLLPDGSMVSVGGGVGIRNGDQWAADEAQKQVELWDPGTAGWRLGPAQAENRAYHSTGMLLPDGRVVSAGDDVNGGIDRDTAEIYEPPYLFKGPRPTISAAPTTVEVGTSFDVNTPDTNVTKAVLVAPAAVTHAVDMNQRHVPLTLSPRSGGVRLNAPANAEIAPPGFYMLFLLNDRGVPSVAKWVRLAGSASATSQDVAAGRPTSASSVEKVGLESGKAVDASPTTRWSSNFTDGQWWQVDLGAQRRIDRVELNWEHAYASRYRILASADGNSFSQAADVSIAGPGWKATSFPAREARFVRVEGVTRATQYGISFWDARVFAAGDAAPPPPPPPPPSSYADAIKGTSGVSGYWRLGEATGTVAAPAVGTMNGTYGSGVTLGSPA